MVDFDVFQPYPLTPSFVSSQIMTVANLLTNFPAGSTYVGMYARVSDLWGSVDEVMRCCQNGGTYYWRPQRTDFAGASSNTTGTITLTPLVTPPMLWLTGSLLGNMTVTPSSTNAWPGCTFEVIAAGTLGIFGITISNVVSGVTSLLLGNNKFLTYDGTNWRARP